MLRLAAFRIWYRIIGPFTIPGCRKSSSASHVFGQGLKVDRAPLRSWKSRRIPPRLAGGRTHDPRFPSSPCAVRSALHTAVRRALLAGFTNTWSIHACVRRSPSLIRLLALSPWIAHFLSQQPATGVLRKPSSPFRWANCCDFADRPCRRTRFSL